MPDPAYGSLLDQMHALPTRSRQKAERRALRAVGDFMAAEIIAATPERVTGPSGTALAPGELAAGIKARVRIASDEDVVAGRSSSVIIGPGKKTAHVANWVENGHANVHAGYSRLSSKGGRRGSGKVSAGKPSTPPHPFIRPTFDENEQAAIDLYTAEMTSQLQEDMK